MLRGDAAGCHGQSRNKQTRAAVAAAKLTLTRVDTLLAELYGVPDFDAFAKKKAEKKAGKEGK